MCRLQNKVIDLEAAARTPSPTVDPSVRVILIGHSMGGIVAAEALLNIARDQPILPTKASTPPPGSSNRNNTTTDSSSGLSSARASKVNLTLNVPQQTTRSSSAPPKERAEPPNNSDSGTADFSEPSTLLFPHIQAVCAFDTPYFGLNPGVAAHTAETHINTASKVWKAYTTVNDMFGTAPQQAGAAKAALPAANSTWSWGRTALFVGSAAAAAVAGGAAWKSRSQISEGVLWVMDHLKFVGCLSRQAELEQRVDAVTKLCQTHRVGFANFYTCLDPEKQEKTEYAAQLVGEERTFCVVPKGAQVSIEVAMEQTERGESPSKKRKTSKKAAPAKKSKSKGSWIECVNDRATSEINAHVSMFTPKDNSDYDDMRNGAKKFIVSSVDREWYESSAEMQNSDQQRAAEECEAGAERDQELGKAEVEAEEAEEAAKARAEVDAEVQAELAAKG